MKKGIASRGLRSKGSAARSNGRARCPRSNAQPLETFEGVSSGKILGGSGDTKDTGRKAPGVGELTFSVPILGVRDEFSGKVQRIMDDLRSVSQQEFQFYRFLTLAAITVVIVFVAGCNVFTSINQATDRAAIAAGYCQQVAVGSDARIWVKCP